MRFCFLFHPKSLHKKQWFLYPFLLLILTFTILGIHSCTNDSFRFHRFSEKLFVSELSDNTLNLHYTLAYPESYNITAKTALPIYSEGYLPSFEKEELLSLLSQLSTISKEELNPRDSYAYDLLIRHLNHKLIGTDFAYYAEPFSPNSGIQSNLPILLADYTFRRKQDVEDYLTILEQSENYIDGLLLYETEKANAGLFMADYSAQKVISQCDIIMDKSLLENGTHFLHTTFAMRLTELEANGILTSSEVASFLSENDRLLTTVMRPAYEKISDTFTLLKGKGINEKGLSYFPKGQAYYQYLLSSVTGSDRSVAEIKRILFTDFQKNYNALLTLLDEYPEIADSQIVNSFSLPLSTPEEMLTDLSKRMEKDFPSFPSADSSFTPDVAIKKVSSSMENYSSPAYYLTPPIDDPLHNIIYINGKNTSDSLTLYTTLAHEGYPGHLYQTVYNHLYSTNQNDPLIRHLLHYGGYVEGWAFYVEDLSYQYAKEHVKNNAYACAYYEACRLNRNIHLCLYSLLDIAIHYDGASYMEVKAILQTIGITNPETARSIYQYIVEEPCNYLKYYLGFLEINMLKERASLLWKQDYSLYRFHQFMLETGPSDFIGLREQLQASSSSNILSK